MVVVLLLLLLLSLLFHYYSDAAALVRTHTHFERKGKRATGVAGLARLRFHCFIKRSWGTGKRAKREKSVRAIYISGTFNNEWSSMAHGGLYDTRNATRQIKIKKERKRTRSSSSSSFSSLSRKELCGRGRVLDSLFAAGEAQLSVPLVH